MFASDSQEIRQRSKLSWNTKPIEMVIISKHIARINLIVWSGGPNPRPIGPKDPRF